MLSFEDMWELSQDLTSDSDTTIKTMLQRFINVGQHKLEAMLGIYFNQITRTFTTVTDTISGTSDQAYRLPENFKSLIELYVTVGTTQYPAEQIHDDALWRDINATTTQTKSNYVEFCFIKDDRIELWPIPSTAQTATIRYIASGGDLTQDDYVTGTITTLANGGTAVTGSGTTWTSGMAGRYFKINADGEWYKISAFGTTTTITLASKYQGVAIASGTSAYTIGQMPRTPEDTHILPVYFATWQYFLFRKNASQAREYERMWKEGIVQAKMDWGNRSYSSVMYDARANRRRGLVNPNDFPESLS